MRKSLIAVLCAVILLVSIAAAQVALPTKAVQATDTSIAKPIVVSQANAFGLKADKSQCTCSADTLAKIEQIKKLLAELENSCMIVENPGRTPPSQPTFSSGNCVDKCMVEQDAKGYCNGNCVRDGVLDTVCFDGCYGSLKVKCENSCNVGNQKPAEQPGCIDTCMAKNYDKAGCLAGCTEEDIMNNGPCYKACQDKANEVYTMCQKQCVKEETTTVPAQTTDVLSQCSSSCELKYSDCKNSCYANAGTDFKVAEDCTVNTCTPLLKQCSVSCNSQYGQKENFVQKVVNVFKPAQFRNAKWICHDGTESVEGGDTSCKPSDTWSTYAKLVCDGKCSTETNKCGVNSFMVYNEC